MTWRAIAPGGLQFAYRGNGGAAEVTGLEFELQAYPSDVLQLGATIGYTKAELTENLPVVDDGIEGDELPYVPEYSFSLSGRYEFPALTFLDGTGFIRGDLTSQDDQVNRLRHTDLTYREIDSYSVVNLRIGLVGDSWSAIAGVNNVFDETTAYTFNGNSPPNVGFVPPGEVRPWQRTFFVGLRRLF